MSAVNLFDWTKDIRNPIVSSYDSFGEAFKYIYDTHPEKDIKDVGPDNHGVILVFLDDDYSFAICPQSTLPKALDPKQKFSRLFKKG